MAESFDEKVAVAVNYADALYDLASEQGALDRVRSELDELVKLEEIEPNFAVFMQSPAVDDTVRAAGLEKMFRGKLSDTVLDTLLVMNRHFRTALLAALRRAFILRQEQEAGQVEVRVRSAVALDDAQKKDAADTAAKLSGRTPVMEFVVEPELLGGLVIEIGDMRVDNSVRRQLQVARQRLLERSARGLRVGGAA